MKIRYTPITIAAFSFLVLHLPIFLGNIETTFVKLVPSNEAKITAIALTVVYLICALYESIVGARSQNLIVDINYRDQEVRKLFQLFSYLCLGLIITTANPLLIFIDRAAYLRSTQYAFLFGMMVPIASLNALCSLISSNRKSLTSLLFNLTPILFITVIGFRAPLVIIAIAYSIHRLYFMKKLNLFSKKVINLILIGIIAIFLLSAGRLLQIALVQEKNPSLIEILDQTGSFMLTGEIGQVSHNFDSVFAQGFLCKGDYNFGSAILEQVPLIGSSLGLSEKTSRFSDCLNIYYADLVSAKSGSNIFSEFYFSMSEVGLILAIALQMAVLVVYCNLYGRSRSILTRAALSYTIAWFAFYFYRSNLVLSLGILKLSIYVALLCFVINFIKSKYQVNDK